MARHTGIGTGLSMIGGAALGAALMYLMDPEKGPERRKHAHDLANDALARAGTSLGHAGASIGTAGACAARSAQEAAATASDSAGSLWSSLTAKARDLASSLGEHAHHASGAAADTGSSAIDSARDAVSSFTSRAKSAASDAYDRARSRLGADEETSYTAPIAISATTAGLLGLAAWYFLDPKHGKARRQRVYNMACDVIDGTADMARNVGSRLSGRDQGPMEYATSDDYVGQMPPTPPTVAESELSSATAPKGL